MCVGLIIKKQDGRTSGLALDFVNHAVRADRRGGGAWHLLNCHSLFPASPVQMWHEPEPLLSSCVFGRVGVWFGGWLDE